MTVSISSNVAGFGAQNTPNLSVTVASWGYHGVYTLSFITHPQSQTVIEGQSVVFTAEAIGAEPITYQWYKNGVLQAGETGTTFSFLAELSDSGATIFCRATNSLGSVDSDTATLTILRSSYQITKDDYYTREQPAKSAELKNFVSVPITSYTTVTGVELFKTGNKISLDGGETFDLIAYYSKKPALTAGAISSLVDDTGAALAITSETYYSNRAELTISNVNPPGNIGDANVLVTGTHLEEQGEQIVVAEDTDSQLEWGVQKYDYPKNPLIQDTETAEKVANTLLDSYKIYRKDTTIEWRGNPALELGDTIIVPEYQREPDNILGSFKIYRNRIQYNGTLRETTEGRKVNE